ncbi:MAG: dihydropteroate synthase [Synergistaceae bacterium]|jgi:dihydropteroate synthase|nr:dihydropteroate synthase [Synergistaceae bacterium]
MSINLPNDGSGKTPMFGVPLFGGRKLPMGRTLVMGILNVTNDSFYAQSRAADERDAVSRALSMARAGADALDIGAESTRPGSRGIQAETEREVLTPVIGAIRRELPDMPLSADTRHAIAASAAIEAGADIINDVSGLGLPDEAPAMMSLLSETGAAYVLTHTKGTPDVMQRAPVYGDLISEIRTFFDEKIRALKSAGVPREKLIIDPGIGFGKRASDNLTLLANVEKFFSFGLPVLVGASRKRFIGNIAGGAAKDDPAERLEGTLAITSLCAVAGVNIVRVHDVSANRRTVDMIEAIARHRL